MNHIWYFFLYSGQTQTKTKEARVEQPEMKKKKNKKIIWFSLKLAGFELTFLDMNQFLYLTITYL